MQIFGEEKYSRKILTALKPVVFTDCLFKQSIHRWKAHTKYVLRWEPTENLCKVIVIRTEVERESKRSLIMVWKFPSNTEEHDEFIDLPNTHIYKVFGINEQRKQIGSLLQY